MIDAEDQIGIEKNPISFPIFRDLKKLEYSKEYQIPNIGVLTAIHNKFPEYVKSFHFVLIEDNETKIKRNWTLCTLRNIFYQ